MKFFSLMREKFCKGCSYYDNSLPTTEDDVRISISYPDSEIQYRCKLEPFDKCIIMYLTGADGFDEEF